MNREATDYGLLRKNPRTKANNRENSRGVFEFDLKIIEFCPKYANFAQNHGIIREFCGFLAKPPSTKLLNAVRYGIQKNNRELSAIFCGFVAQPPSAVAPPKVNIFAQLGPPMSLPALLIDSFHKEVMSNLVVNNE